MDLRLVKVIPQKALNSDSPNRLYIVFKIWGESGIHHGIRSVTIGSAERLFKEYYSGIAVSLIIVSIYIVFGFLAIVIGTRQQHILSARYFGIFCLSFALFQAANLDCKFLLFGNNVTFRMHVDQISLKIFTAAFTLFVVHFFTQTHTRIGKALAVYCGLLAVIDIFRTFGPLYHYFSYLWYLAAAIGFVHIITVLVSEIRNHRNRDATLMLGSMVFVCIGSIHDIFLTKFIITGTYILHFCFLIAISTIVIIMMKRFVLIFRQYEELNTSLEQKIDERTEELKSANKTIYLLTRKKNFIESFDLTPRESQILELMLDGVSVSELADDLFISLRTVNNHIYKIYKKLNVYSLREIISLYSRF